MTDYKTGIICLLIVIIFIGLFYGRKVYANKMFEKGLAYAFNDKAKDAYRNLLGDYDGYDKLYNEYCDYLKSVKAENPRRLKEMLHYEQETGFIKLSFYDFLKSHPEKQMGNIYESAKKLATKEGYNNFPYARQ